MNARKAPKAPEFDAPFRARLRDLVAWRRDVRRFRTDPVPEELVMALIEIATLAPSVGLSQPWRFVLVESEGCRRAVARSFADCNARALEGYDGERRQQYARLKLSGLERAPVHLAVFADEATDTGHGLGRQTMPEMVRYSVVAAVQTMWLAARAEGLGVGWVSILDPRTVTAAVDVPEDWALVAYLCLGWPEEEHLEPELARAGWEMRQPLDALLLRR